VEQNGSTVEDFQALSQRALKDEDEFSERRFFIEVYLELDSMSLFAVFSSSNSLFSVLHVFNKQALLATTEYETFLGLMKNEVRRLKATGK
jgi:hypothetical protein